MKWSRSLFLFVLAIWFVGCAGTPKPKRLPRHAARAGNSQREVLGQKYHRTTLPNGLEIIVVPTKQVPLVTIEVAVRTGAYTEDADNDGLAHLYEHMFFKGNATLPKQEDFLRRVKELGIIYNGTTSDEAVKYFFTLPSSNLEPGMEFMSQALMTPSFDSEELSKERLVVIEEYNRNESNPNFYLGQEITRKLFWKYPHKKNPIGNRQVVKTATVEQMEFFKDTFYIPNNSALLVLGDVNPATTFMLARKYFGHWKRGEDPFKAHPLPEHPPIQKDEHLFVPQNLGVAVLRASAHGPSVLKDPAVTYALDCWGAMLGLPTSRFHAQFVESQLTYGASMWYYTQRHGAEVGFFAQCNPDKVIAVRDAWRAEMAKFDDPGYFTEEDLEHAKRELINSTLYEREEGSEYIQTLAFWWCVAGLEYHMNYLEEIQKVTLEDVRNAVRKYVQGQKWVVGATTNQQAADAVGLSAETLAAGDGPVEGNAAGPDVAQVKDLGDGLYTFELSNGTPVLFRQTPGSPVTATKVFIDGGSRGFAEGEDGIENLALRTVLRGSEEWPYEKMQQALVELGSEFATQSNYDYSTVSMKALSTAYGKSLRIFSTLLQNPGFTTDDLEYVRKQMLNDLQAQNDQPDDQVWFVANEVFFDGHPYSRYPNGTPETVPGLTLEAAKEHFESTFVSDRLLVVVVGDLPLNSLPSQVEAAFGWVKPGGEKLEQVPPFEATKNLKLDDRNIPAAYIVAKFPAPLPDSSDFHAARIGLSILGERLYKELRTNQALCYAVFSGQSQYGANYGYFYLSTQYPDAAAHWLHKTIRDTLDSGVSQQELDFQANEYYTGFFMSQDVTDSQASTLGMSFLSYGDPLQAWKAVEGIKNLEVADINAALKKVMGDEEYSVGVIGPRDKVTDGVILGTEKYSGPTSRQELEKSN